MKTKTKLFFLLLLSLSVTFISCEKEPGCMDPNSLTYNPDAKKDDGTCIYAYDIALGIWNMDPDCEEYTIPVIGTTVSLNDQLPDSIYVQGDDGVDDLFIDIDGTQLSGTIDYEGNVLVDPQTISIDMGFGPMDIDVSGSGFISSSTLGSMDLTYSFDIDIVPGFPISESLDCSISLTR
ncbi:hypothetical protein OAJ56_01180 [Flavobacteriales bacterium]|nr:hypothetical protein [Flavobacteriales bacterium]